MDPHISSLVLLQGKGKVGQPETGFKYFFQLTILKRCLSKVAF